MIKVTKCKCQFVHRFGFDVQSKMSQHDPSSVTKFRFKAVCVCVCVWAAMCITSVAVARGYPGTCHCMQHARTLKHSSVAGTHPHPYSSSSAFRTKPAKASRTERANEALLGFHWEASSVASLPPRVALWLHIFPCIPACCDLP